MRIGIVSDIHGNDIGLQAALSRLRLYEPERIVCLGDVAQGGAQPRESVETLRELGCPVLMGNADHWLITGEEAEDSADPAPSEEQQEVRLWSLEQLSQDNVEFLRDCPFSLDLALANDLTACCVHGTLRSFNEVVLPETPIDEVETAFAGTSAAILAGGHTHLQWMRRWKDRLFFNPGSAGHAYERHLFDDGEPIPYVEPWAEFAVLTVTDANPSVEFGKAPFDPEDLKRTTLNSGRPHAESAAAAYRSY